VAGARVIVSEQNDSMSRFLTYRLSPAAVQLSTNQDSRMTYISTDDVSLQHFISHFHNLAVKVIIDVLELNANTGEIRYANYLQYTLYWQQLGVPALKACTRSLPFFGPCVSLRL